MQRQLDQWTVGLSAALVIVALLACKKKQDEPAPAAKEPPAATASAPVAAPSATEQAAIAATTAPKLGDVKRFAGKEKEAAGAVKVLENDVKVFNEPDEKGADVATLSKDIFVFRLATLDDKWVLVEFPSGVGKVSPGWVEAKFLETKVEGVARETVAKQTKSATIKPASSALPPSSAKPAASVAAAPSASVKPVASAPKPAESAKPVATAAPKGTSTPTAKKTPSLKK